MTRRRKTIIRASYDAAGTGRRLGAWGAVGGGPTSTVASNLETLRARSRDAVRNQAWADAAVDVITTNVIGTGIKPQFATPDSGLNKELAELWLAWTDEADADQALDFYGLQALAVRSMVEGGESFTRRRLRRAADALTVPLQLQVLESEHCPATKTEAYGNAVIRSGVEISPIGGKTAYWLTPFHPSDASGFVLDNQARRIPASEIAHLLQLRRPGQLRGEPWLTRALIKLHELDQYDDAELVRKKLAAMLVGFRRKPLPAGMTADELQELWGEDAEVADGVGVVTLEAGTIQDLDVGEDVTFNNPADVGNSYDPFIRSQFRGLAAAAGILYEQLTGDYSQINDRTYRASVNEFRRRAAMWQHHIVAFQLCRRVHRWWMEAAVLSGAIRLPAGMTTAEALRVKWVPQAWPYIHPVQDVDASVKEIRSGLTSRSAKVSERGEDAERIDAEQQADNARADELGVSYDSDGRRAVSDPTKSAIEPNEA